MDAYYNVEDQNRLEEFGEHRAELFAAFRQWYDKTLSPSALDAKTKSLIALAVAHVLRCPYSIDSAAIKCSDAGATMEQMCEAIHVASAMSACSTLAHGIQTVNALERV